MFSDKINRQIVGIVGTDSGFVMRENQPASEMSPPIENGRVIASSSAIPWRDLCNLYSHFQCPNILLPRKSIVILVAGCTYIPGTFRRPMTTRAYH